MTINFSDTFSLPIVFPSQLSCAALFSLAKFIVIRYDALVVWVDSDWDLFVSRPFVSSLSLEATLKAVRHMLRYSHTT